MATSTLTTVTGKVTRTAIVRPKVVFTSVDVDGKKLQLTLFRTNAPSHYADIIDNWQLGQTVTVTGSMEPNPFNGEDQLIVSSIAGASVPIQDTPPSSQTAEPVTASQSQSITITKDMQTFKDQWGRNWLMLPDSF